MRILKITINKLFGTFDHVIQLNQTERLTIITGPNGHGKTIILKMIHGLFKKKYSIFGTIPFTEFKVVFDDFSFITVITERESEQNKVKLLYTDSKGKVEAAYYPPTPRNGKPRSYGYSRVLEQLVEGLIAMGPNQWRYMQTGEILNTVEVLERFSDIIPAEFRKELGIHEQPKWLTSIINMMDVTLVEADRLYDIAIDRNSYDKK